MTEDIRIYTDDEIEKIKKMLVDVMPSLLPASKRIGVDMGQHFRLSSLGLGFKKKREERGLSVREVSLATKIPQYRIKAIEGGSHREIRQDFLAELSRYLDLNAWCFQWAQKNIELAKVLGIDSWEGSTIGSEG